MVYYSMNVFEINSEVMRENARTLRSKLNPGVKICCVVKANGYSLGDVFVAKALDDYSDCFAVAHMSEALRLREAGIEKDIILFGVCEDLAMAEKLNLTISINSLHEARNASKNVASIKIHIMVDTGMTRYGISKTQELETIFKLLKNNIEGVYTHFAYEEDNMDGIRKQLDRFQPFVDLARKLDPNIMIHAAHAGAAHYPPAQFDMVRVGKSFYGGYPGYKTAIKYTSNIVAVHDLEAGGKVSYRGLFVADKPMKVGVVACGYADGVHINFGDKTHVLVDEKPCNITGRVCMDAFMIDVTDIETPLGKEVTIVGDLPGITIMEQMDKTGAVTCDFLCGLNFDRANVKILHEELGQDPGYCQE